MFKSICIVFICLACIGSVWAETKTVKIAQVNFSQLEKPLRDYVLAKEENVDLKKKHDFYQKKQEEEMERMMRDFMPVKETGKIEEAFPGYFHRIFFGKYHSLLKHKKAEPLSHDVLPFARFGSP